MILSVMAVSGYLYVVFAVSGRELFGGLLTHQCTTITTNSTLRMLECPDCSSFIDPDLCPVVLECDANSFDC